MKRICFFIANLLVVMFILSSCKTLKETTDNSFNLQPGDLLFQDSDCGPFCTSIEKVTFGYKGSKFSHIGMVVNDNQDDIKIIEAVTAGVIITPLDEFLNRARDVDGNSKVMVGRVDENHQALIPQAIKFSKTKLGLAYDEIFDINNNKYYCSELIYDAFKYAHDGIPLFHLKPMTFVDPDTKKTFPIWADYYEDLGEEIPEGNPGLNPGGISQSDYIQIVHVYGKPDGYVGK